MKQFFLLMLIINPAIASGQDSKKDSLIREVDEYAKNASEAVDQFLNKRLTTQQRLDVIRPFSVLYDQNQKDRFRAVVMDREETPEIRAMALNKIYDRVYGDQQLMNQVLEWLGNPETPKVLRDETLQAAANLAFSSIGVADVYQKLLEDPEQPFRIFGFTQLIIHGDPRAQQLLIRGLENPETALLPAHTAIHILSMAVKNEHYPAVYKVLLETKDEDARLAAIRALGYYKEARPKLIEISRNPEEKEQFREAALGALYGGDRNNIVSYVTPILNDRSASPRLQAIAVQMTIDVRQSMAHRAKAKRADDYDILVRNIAEGRGVNRSEEVIKVANKYIQSVRPRY